MLHIEFSNRFERLLDSLLDRMGAADASPFTRDEIIIPSAAVKRRIELSAADRFGVCANVEFSYLAEWLWRQIGRFVPVSPVSPFRAPVMTWRVYQHLGDAALVGAHPRLESYLKSADATMRYDLAVRVAALFDQYVTYRPDWLAQWRDNRDLTPKDATDAHREDERWQAALWRRIAAEIGTGRQHPSVAFFDAMNRMGASANGAERGATVGAAASGVAPPHAALPATAHVFCLPSTPPLYIDILRGLGRWIDLHVYVLNPSREYWFEIVDPKRLSYLKLTAREAHAEVGNRLLASWGKQTRAHIDLLLALEGEIDLADHFEPSGKTTLLGRVQDAILDLVDPAPGTFHVDESEALAKNDRSIEVHVCHSLTRELEVLHDQLLGAFAGSHPPRPSDIVVLTPDLAEAAPLIDAVFGTAPHSRWIPYAITGRPSSTQNSAARALLAVLSLATSRFHASAVFELLQQPIIARRFDIDDDERETIRRWIRQSGIRWGLDGAQRASMNLPPVGHHTFDDGLDRLFMGYALPSNAALPLGGRLPAGNPEGSESLALGSFDRLMDGLERLRDAIATPRSAAEWRAMLQGVMDAFLLPVDDEIDELRETEAAIRDLHTNMTQGALGAQSGHAAQGAQAAKSAQTSQPAQGGAIPFDVLVAALRSALEDASRGGVPTGSVTFSSMSSLRNLPYRHVCVIGLCDGAFPSAARPDEFDLMALTVRRGDRQRRLDERNLFLDIVLSARETLYLSYTGRSVRDNAVLPPSVVVAEFIDHVASAAAASPVTPKSIAKARERLTVEHPLQPFSPGYFNATSDDRTRSFNDEYRAALAARFGAIQPPKESLSVPGSSTAAGDFTPSPEDEEIAAEAQRAFFGAPLAAAGPELREVTMQQLNRFFFNPSAFLLKQRIGLDLPRTEDELSDDEPFVPEWRDRCAMANRILPRLIEGEPATNLQELARAGVEYPPGRLGEIELDRELERIAAFAGRVRSDSREDCIAPFEHTFQFDIDGEQWSLSGALGDVRPSGLIRHLYDDVRPTEYLNGWLQHLFLNAAAPVGVTTRTVWHSRDGKYKLNPCGADRAQELLATLMAMYRAGLHRPLHFYPRTAWKYARKERYPDAYNAWRTTPYKPYPGEDQKPGYSIALRGVEDPLDEEFVGVAMAVFGPMLRLIEDPRL